MTTVVRENHDESFKSGVHELQTSARRMPGFRPLSFGLTKQETYAMCSSLSTPFRHVRDPLVGPKLSLPASASLKILLGAILQWAFLSVSTAVLRTYEKLPDETTVTTAVTAVVAEP